MNTKKRFILERFHTVVMTRPVLCVSRLILCWQPRWIIRLDLWVTVDNLISAQLALTGTTGSDQKRNLKQRRHKRWVFNTLSQQFLSLWILVPARHFILTSIMFYLLCHKKCLSKVWFILTLFKSSRQSDKFDTSYSSPWWNYHSPRLSLDTVMSFLISTIASGQTWIPDVDSEEEWGVGGAILNLLSYLSIFITNRHWPLINSGRKKR